MDHTTASHIDRAAEVLHKAWIERCGVAAPTRDHVDAFARALDAAGLLRDDIEVQITEQVGEPSECVVKRHGVTVFNGVSWGALLRERADRIEAGGSDA